MLILFIPAEPASLDFFMYRGAIGRRVDCHLFSVPVHVLSGGWQAISAIIRYFTVHAVTGTRSVLRADSG
ncbi:hypothetical protein D1872_224820 [compost metagenome]